MYFEELLMYLNGFACFLNDCHVCNIFPSICRMFTLYLFALSLLFGQPYVDDFVESSTPSDAGPCIRNPLGDPHYEPSPSLNSSDWEPNKLEADELRRQLQLLKTQAVAALDQARKATECADAATRQASQASALEAAATLKASQAEDRENYLIELMTRAGQDVTGNTFLRGAPEPPSR